MSAVIIERAAERKRGLGEIQPERTLSYVISTYREHLKRAARDYLATVCANRTLDEAARVAGIHRSNLYRLRRELGIRDRTKHYGRWTCD